MYLVLVYVHIVAAIIWVGGAFFSQLLAIRAARSTDSGDLPKFARQAEFLGMRVFLPASILLFIAGLVMVAQQWSFGQVWVSVSMGLWIVSALAGSLYLGPVRRRSLSCSKRRVLPPLLPAPCWTGSSWSRAWNS